MILGAALATTIYAIGTILGYYMNIHTHDVSTSYLLTWSVASIINIVITSAVLQSSRYYAQPNHAWQQRYHQYWRAHLVPDMITAVDQFNQYRATLSSNARSHGRYREMVRLDALIQDAMRNAPTLTFTNAQHPARNVARLNALMQH